MLNTVLDQPAFNAIFLYVYWCSSCHCIFYAGSVLEGNTACAEHSLWVKTQLRVDKGLPVM